MGTNPGEIECFAQDLQIREETCGSSLSEEMLIDEPTRRVLRKKRGVGQDEHQEALFVAKYFKTYTYVDVDVRGG